MCCEETYLSLWRGLSVSVKVGCDLKRPGSERAWGRHIYKSSGVTSGDLVQLLHHVRGGNVTQASRLLLLLLLCGQQKDLTIMTCTQGTPPHHAGHRPD
jgi:hypothetical protein